MLFIQGEGMVCSKNRASRDLAEATKSLYLRFLKSFLFCLRCLVYGIIGAMLLGSAYSGNYHYNNHHLHAFDRGIEVDFTFVSDNKNKKK